jgi:hypothetical protein
MLNTVTRPFVFPIARCDKAVERVGDAQCCITADLDAGCWQVKMNKSSKDRTAFFSSNGKKHWNSMPMGAMNAHAFFVAMASEMEIKWNAPCGERTRKRKEIEGEWLTTKIEEALRTIKETRDVSDSNKKVKADELESLSPRKEALFSPTWQKPGEFDLLPGSAVIVDSIILFAHAASALLCHFTCMIDILQHH